MVSRSVISAPCYGDLALGGVEFEELKSLRILGVSIDFKLTFETHLREIISRTPGICRSCAELESYLNVYVCSRAVSMPMFCPAWSIVISCGCRRRSLICVCWIALFALRIGYVRVSFVV